MAFDILTYVMAKGSGGGGGATDYTQLRNLPKINGTTVTGDLDADALGIANCKYYTLVLGETNKFVDADGTELAIASVYEDMARFVMEDKSNIAIINVTMASDDEIGHTVPLGKLFYTGIIVEEDSILQFYAKINGSEYICLVTEDTATFNMRNADFVVHGILTMTSETTATISDLTADYEAIKEAIDSGSNVKLIVVVSGTDTIIEFTHIVYGTDTTNKKYVQFDTVSASRQSKIVVYEDGNNAVAITRIPQMPTVTTQTSPSNISINDNSEYYLTDVSSCAFSYPTGNFECWMRLTTAASGTVTITLPTSQYIGDAPSFGNGETWEISIKDGVVASAKVGA